jgi:tRNA(Ile)-lysidine synthase
VSAAALPAIEIPAAADGRLIVGFSGGLDSTVLLHRLAAQGARPRLLAAHVDHGLQAQAGQWAAQAGRVCAELGVAFELLRVQVPPAHPGGPEAAARDARYQALVALMGPGDALVTAHQRDDQAETVLLRLLRGSGIDGLAAMRPLSAFGPGWLWRPLLEVPRAALLAYARDHGLGWIEDPHNGDPRFARSWLRGEVMPLLRQHFPQAVESLARTAALAAEAAEVLADAGTQDLRAAAAGVALRGEVVQSLPAARRRNLLRVWLRAQGHDAPGAAAIRRLEWEVLAAAPAAAPLLAWPGCEVRRYRGLLYAMAPLPPAPSGQVLRWSDAVLALPPGCGRLCLPAPPVQALTVRFPSGGERFLPARAAHRRTLKNLFQEAAVPPWVRQRTPLVEVRGELAYVAGLGPGARWAGAAVQWLDAPRGAPAAGREASANVAPASIPPS